MQVQAFSFYFGLYKNVYIQHQCFLKVLPWRWTTLVLSHCPWTSTCSQHPYHIPDSLPWKSGKEVMWNTLQFLLYRAFSLRWFYFVILFLSFFFFPLFEDAFIFYYFLFFFPSKSRSTPSEMNMLKINFHLQSLHLKGNP